MDGPVHGFDWENDRPTNKPTATDDDMIDGHNRVQGVLVVH